MPFPHHFQTFQDILPDFLGFNKVSFSAKAQHPIQHFYPVIGSELIRKPTSFG
jgi:hypothetical protein